MIFTEKCASLDKAYCPSCGSKNIVGKLTSHCHCGQCGASITIEVIEKVKVNEEAEKYDQLSLF